MSRQIVPNVRCRPGASDDLLLQRARFLAEVRAFFGRRGFLEVETPHLSPSADPSPHLRSFRTTLHLPEANHTTYLLTSPEFPMKRLVTAGYSRIFQICKFFRDGEISPLHNPEFTGLEWYSAGHDYHEVMALTEAMICEMWSSWGGGETLTYQGNTIDLRRPWERLTCYEAIARYAGVELRVGASYEELAQACRSLGLSVVEDDAWDDLFFKIFLTFVEPKLGLASPVFLTEYPIQMAALARAKPGVPEVAERVELYLGGVELANGYSELTDRAIQEARWKEEIAYRRGQGETELPPMDQGLLDALALGMPECTGVAVGLDRLFMLFLDAPTLQEVLAFPMTTFQWPSSTVKKDNGD